MTLPSFHHRPWLKALVLAALYGFHAAASANSPILSQFTMSPSGPQFWITSDLGVSNEIQCASTLNTGLWTSLTNLLVAQSPYTFVDASANASGQRFYRVIMSAAGGTVPPGMALIPAGNFQMGDAFGEGAAYEQPVHTVYVSTFYMDKYEVSKGLWDQVLSWGITNGYSFENTGAAKGTNHPVLLINWFDMVKWCNARSEMEHRVPCYYTDAGLTQVYRSGEVNPFVIWTAGYRLPTEAEWEKAARGGASGHRFPWADTDTIDQTRANYFSDSTVYSYDVNPIQGFDPAFDDGVQPFTSPIGSFPPNGYGLYDMAGNAWEWCWDWAGNYTSDPQTDPRGPATGDTRVGKGGNWNYYAVDCRCSYRYGNSPTYTATNVGFRTAMGAP